MVIEDLAYFGMDFRRDYSRPGQPPFQPSVAHHTKNFILLISSSKVFSYAGERIGMLVVSDTIWNKRAPDLKRYYPSDLLGYALVFGAIYALSSGTSHSAQYALAAVLKAVNNGELNYVDGVREYGEKSHVMKRMYRQRLPHRLRDGPGRANRGRLLLHVLVSGADRRGPAAGVDVCTARTI